MELEYLLKIAIEDEEYEIASDLRDEIKRRIEN
jgi:protein-arginine kinase activator protein McsA